MARLAALDRTVEEQIEALEQQTGKWLVAYAPEAAGDAPPEYVRQLKPAMLEGSALERLRELERQTGTIIVAYEPLAAA